MHEYEYNSPRLFFMLVTNLNFICSIHLRIVLMGLSFCSYSLQWNFIKSSAAKTLAHALISNTTMELLE